jgi:hypothetical protein
LERRRGPHVHDGRCAAMAAAAVALRSRSEPRLV